MTPSAAGFTLTMDPRSSGPFVADLGAGFGDESFAYVDPPGLPVDLEIRDGQLSASWTRGVTAREVADVLTLVRVWDGAACERVATGKLLVTSNASPGGGLDDEVTG